MHRFFSVSILNRALKPAEKFAKLQAFPNRISAGWTEELFKRETKIKNKSRKEVKFEAHQTKLFEQGRISRYFIVANLNFKA